MTVATKYLLQQGNGWCGSMLKHAMPWHQQYANRHNMVYVAHLGSWPVKNCGRKPRKPEWQKPPFILNWLDQSSPGDILVYLDTDAVIVRPEDDLTFALPEGYDIGMVKARYCKSEFYNCGMVVMRNNRVTRDFWQLIDEMGPGIGLHAHDEGRLNKVIKDGHEIVVCDLPGEYNACNYTSFDKDRVIVQAWHGIPRDTAERRVKETVWQLSKQTSPLV